MERTTRGKGKQRLLGSHQRCWIWGRNAVLETLTAGRWPIVELYLADDLPTDLQAKAHDLARPQGLTPVLDTTEGLTRRCHSAEHQGFLAKMTEFPYTAEDALWPRLSLRPLCALLDGIQDPHNFGAIVRSAEVLGVEAVFIGAAGQTGVTSLAVRSSAGAVNRVPIVQVAELEALAGRLKARGLLLVGASEKADVPLGAFDFKRPVALVIGNEGGGIRTGLIKQCDALVAIPQHGRIGSLNAAVAAAVCFYEAQRQRGG